MVRLQDARGQSAPAPTSRPVWLTVLTSSMLVYGGVTLVSALLMLREPRAMAVMAIENMARPADSAAESTETIQKLEALSNAIVERHKAEVRAGALISLGVALLTLYTVAALLSRDPHGRKLAMVTAGVRDPLSARRSAARRGDGPAGGHRGGRAPVAGRDRERAGAARVHGGPASPPDGGPGDPGRRAGCPRLPGRCCITSAAGGAARSTDSIRDARTSADRRRPRLVSGGKVPSCSPSRLGRLWRLG